jgi:hypothetical protein
MSRNRKFIIVDENDKPMTWQERSKQLVYTSKRGNSRLFLDSYTEKEAHDLIMQTIDNRKKWGMDTNGYYLMQLNKV